MRTSDINILIRVFSSFFTSLPKRTLYNHVVNRPFRVLFRYFPWQYIQLYRQIIYYTCTTLIPNMILLIEDYFNRSTVFRRLRIRISDGVKSLSSSLSSIIFVGLQFVCCLLFTWLWLEHSDWPPSDWPLIDIVDRVPFNIY